MHKLLYYKILKFQKANLDLLTKNFELIQLDSPLDDTEEILKDVEVIFAPLGFSCNKEKIDKMPNLKVIASNTTGEPHIDREYAESKGIKVFSLKSEKAFLETITPTAEHTWGLAISLVRRIPWAYQSVLDGKWDRRMFGGSAMFSKMTLGIAGLGRLGLMVAKYGRAFNMEKIFFYDPNIVSNPADISLEKVDSLEELVSKSDIVTIHIPAEKETYKIFNKKIFDSFKRGGYLINTSRGELVDEDALIDSLASGHLAGAALDVFDGEYDIDHEKKLANSRLLDYAKSHDNLLLTPHIGGSTYDAWRLTEEHTINLVLNELGL